MTDQPQLDQHALRKRVSLILAETNLYFSVLPTDGGPLWVADFGDPGGDQVRIEIFPVGEWLMITHNAGRLEASLASALLDLNAAVFGAKVGRWPPENNVIVWADVRLENLNAISMLNAIGTVLYGVEKLRTLLGASGLPVPPAAPEGAQRGESE